MGFVGGSNMPAISASGPSGLGPKAIRRLQALVSEASKIAESARLMTLSFTGTGRSPSFSRGSKREQELLEP